jgi:signal transduction histidine kinase
MELAAPSARRRSERLPRRVARGVGCGLLTIAAAGGAAAIAAIAGETPLDALAHAVIVGVPTGVGLGAVGRMENDRFALLLAALGGLMLIATLGDTGDELAYSVGRVSGWLVEVLLVYLILSFPTGRLETGTDRFLFRAMALIVLVLFMPRLLVAQDFAVPSPYTSCTEDCQPNAFFLLEVEPGLVESFLAPAGALAIVAISTAVVVQLTERFREATPLARRVLGMVLAIGVARMALLGAGFVLREADPGLWAVEAVSWALALSVAALAFAFLFALVRWQLFSARALERLGELVPHIPDAAALRLALADAFGDPTLQVAVAPAPAPKPSPGRSVTEVRDRGAVVARVVHDEALRATPHLLHAGLAMAGVVLDNQRLTAEAGGATRELRRSRARIAASAERERRRIERDLHDGAQQRLVALRIELELVEEIIRRDPAEGIGRLRELEAEVDETLEELRSLGHGVYPPLLADCGLPEALRTVAARSPIAVEVVSHEVVRYPPEVESAVYFCVLEALQNVLKHAPSTHRVVVRLTGGRSELSFSVRDDGGGIDSGAVRPGAGITNMRDRLRAVGGDVFVTSALGVGTTVRGRVPASGQIVD